MVAEGELDRGRQGHGKEVIGVVPGLGGGEAGRGQERGNSVRREFVTVFGMYGFARVETVKVKAGPDEVGRDGGDLVGEGLEMHFDARLDWVPTGVRGGILLTRSLRRVRG